MDNETDLSLDGHYFVSYSEQHGGFYAELLWSVQHSPVYSTEREAHMWAWSHGGITNMTGIAKKDVKR